MTSGGQVLESAAELRALGAQINVALCVIDREAGGAETLAAAGVERTSPSRRKGLFGWCSRISA